MPNVEHSQMIKTDRFQRLDETTKEVIFCCLYAPSPVSIDILCSVTGAPAGKVLNAVEQLKKRRIVYEKKQYPKGFYFVGDSAIGDLVQKYQLTDDRETKPVLKRIIDFYEQLPGEDEEKILALAKLYWKLGDTIHGLDHIRKAARMLSRLGNQAAAANYYDYLFQCFSNKKITAEDAVGYLDSTLFRISTGIHLMPSWEQVSLLTQAEKVAKRYGKWESLANIQLALGKLYQQEGQLEKAYEYIKGYRGLADKIGDQRMRKKAVLLLSEFMYWEGKVSEIIQQYEGVIGNLEEFEDDEATLRATARVGICFVLCGRVARGLGMIDTVRAKATSLKLPRVWLFATFMTILALFEIRRIEEAVPYIKETYALPEDVVGEYHLRILKACEAYILCVNGKYEEAFEKHKQYVEHCRRIGWSYRKGDWIFEYLDLLEKNGFLHNVVNYNSEIVLHMNWNDIYMKGTCFRYRALRNMEQQQSTVEVLADLKNSEKYLKRSGGEIELARTYLALGQFYLQSQETKNAQSYLKKAWLILSKIDKRLFPRELLATLPQEQKIEVMIDRIISINESLSEVHDMSSFLERVLNLAMHFTMARRGAFIVVENGTPKMLASRNLDLLMLTAEQDSIIKKVIGIAEKNAEIVIGGTEKKHLISGHTFSKAGITSLICMPVTLGETTHGYLYLDNCLAGPFLDSSIPYVRLFCNQIAVGLSNIRTYDNMKDLQDRLENEVTFYKREVMGVADPMGTIIGKSGAIRQVIDQIHQVAPTDSSVLITGETGVGKELVAKAIHNLSIDKGRPFIAINLAAIPAELIASELFGHERGAFTGANALFRGRFELANEGTIFLDEIGDLPLSVQVKLLRVLQEGVFERLGSTQPIRSKFRVIAATNKDLAGEVEKGTFREDLYYRINVFPILVPPLRERKEDIPLLVDHFLNKLGKRTWSVSDEELKKLETYHWPGNVRELEHFIQRSIILSKSKKITFPNIECGSKTVNSGDDLIITLDEMERKHILKALNATRWRVGGPRGAASILGIKPSTLFFRMKKHGIKRHPE
ncbi:MAG: Formate hydrogenlyase transcriptional activator [Syntrophorhabdus sp. PtaU1.Bin153]|nr:MAG: Formate hydrogenlyase transcriptional activator [Syntrophorhabdus sp. PtaU1.Bin153]